MKNVMLEIEGHLIDVMNGPYLQDGKPTSAACEFATKLILQLDEMRVRAAQELLSLYNMDWRSAEAPILNESEFCSRLINPLVVLLDEIGAASVYFGASGMFSDHCVDIFVDEGKIVNVGISG